MISLVFRYTIILCYSYENIDISIIHLGMATPNRYNQAQKCINVTKNAFNEVNYQFCISRLTNRLPDALRYI